jgi:membrane protein CcdC involved in cytochrome C biogenesis
MFLKKYKLNLIISTLFLVTMAYIESAVVVYLRALYYPSGFRFPLIDIPLFILYVEIGREIATIVMLWSVARLISKNYRECFAFFMYNFGMWDIWYYIWLKILINWPYSLLEWDVLFLIPLTWIGPVLAPLIVSLTLIFTSFVLLKHEYQNKPVYFKRKDWFLEILAGLIIILSFLWETDSIISKRIPASYPWWLFISGLGLGIIVFWRKVKKK